MLELFIVIAFLCFVVFVRRFVPSHGFFADEVTDKVTAIGEKRVIRLRNLEGYSSRDLIQISDVPVQLTTQQQTVQQNTAVQNIKFTEQEGVDLTDLGIKESNQPEVKTNQLNTDYVYANLDSSDESLSSTLKRGGM